MSRQQNRAPRVSNNFNEIQFWNGPNHTTLYVRASSQNPTVIKLALDELRAFQCRIFMHLLINKNKYKYHNLNDNKLIDCYAVILVALSCSDRLNYHYQRIIINGIDYTTKNKILAEELNIIKHLSKYARKCINNAYYDLENNKFNFYNFLNNEISNFLKENKKCIDKLNKFQFDKPLIDNSQIVNRNNRSKQSDLYHPSINTQPNTDSNIDPNWNLSNWNNYENNYNHNGWSQKWKKQNNYNKNWVNYGGTDENIYPVIQKWVKNNGQKTFDGPNHILLLPHCDENESLSDQRVNQRFNRIAMTQNAHTVNHAVCYVINNQNNTNCDKY